MLFVLYALLQILCLSPGVFAVVIPHAGALEQTLNRDPRTEEHSEPTAMVGYSHGGSVSAHMILGNVVLTWSSLTIESLSRRLLT